LTGHIENAIRVDRAIARKDDGLVQGGISASPQRGFHILNGRRPIVIRGIALIEASERGLDQDAGDDGLAGGFDDGEVGGKLPGFERCRKRQSLRSKARSSAIVLNKAQKDIPTRT
jgi:hypothetical protein